LFLDADHGNRIIRDITSDPPARADGAGSGILKSPIDGAVVAVHAAEGDTVKKGQLLLVIEAMKMEHQIKADVAGTIAVFKARKGEQVKVRQLLVEITPAAAE
jgi:geranyl-CoA carboxylase alpha subunit